MRSIAHAIAMWWVPYFRGADERKRSLYAQMYAGTRHLLPPRGSDGLNPRPNLLHIAFHLLFLMTFLLSVDLRLRI